MNARSLTTRENVSQTAKFVINENSKVFSDDGRELLPGSGEVGRLANGGFCPVGYYKDPKKSAETFKVINGHRYSFPGDNAQAAVANLIGALWGTAVAKTIASGLIDQAVVEVTSQVIVCALAGGIVWNLTTWYVGLPSSTSHALGGGLAGAAIAASDGRWSAVIWSQPAEPWYHSAGVLWKVVVPMITSPLLGFAVGLLLMGLVFALFWGMSLSPGVLRRIARPATWGWPTG